LTNFIAGVIIYVVSYLFLARSVEFSNMMLIALVNMVAILVVNGISFNKISPWSPKKYSA